MMGGVKLGELKSVEWTHPDPPLRLPDFSGSFEVSLPEGYLKELEGIQKLPQLYDVEVPPEIIPLIKQAFEEKFPGVHYESIFDGDKLIGVSISYNINFKTEEDGNHQTSPQ